ncbi:MAG: hypothetical protein BV457_02725 [Thermoplasmata archaeon M9B1D]|nr:MAG: hypothetical protein BV457_02725 [Thermoplasmata archaeon M9B1D]PNX50238.1 MAG: hypothetical protein BV456_07310 [Thermoplasmata archaeon M8B2D]
MYFFLLSYSILGAGLKYIDDAFDKKIFNRSIAIAIAPVLSILGAYSMMIDPVSATILLAVICGVLLKGKIDNVAFALGFAVVILIAALSGIQFLVLPLILLTTAAVLDEVGNDYIDSVKDQLNPKNPFHMFTKYFLGHRWIMKTGILFLAIMNLVPLFFLLAMILFDYAYLTVNAYSQVKCQMTSASKIGKVIASVGHIFK